jgi:hypothetical protein
MKYEFSYDIGTKAGWVKSSGEQGGKASRKFRFMFLLRTEAPLVIHRSRRLKKRDLFFYHRVHAKSFDGRRNARS